MRRPISAFIICTVLIGAYPVLLLANADPINTSEASGKTASWYNEDVAIGGQDVISFYSSAGPTTGSEEYSAIWDNTEWQFSSAENRDTFLSDPKKFVPQFGGYCTVALARGETKIGTAKHFTVIDDKLYLNYDSPSQRQFANDPDSYIARAKVTW